MESLQTVLEHRDCKLTDVLKYLEQKQNSQPSANSKPREPVILTGAALGTLLGFSLHGLRGIQVAIVCLEEFVFQDPEDGVDSYWLQLDSQITLLVKTCLECICAAKEPDADGRYFKKLCNVVMSIGEKGDPLSSSLFNCCSNKFMALVFAKNIERHIKSYFLETISSLMWATDTSRIAIALHSLEVYLNHLAPTIISWPAECQVSIYIILSRSICNREEASRKAAVWFSKWPVLQQIFVDHYADFSKGFGLFSSKLWDLKNSSTNTSKSPALAKTKDAKFSAGMPETPGISNDIRRLKRSFIEGTPVTTIKQQYNPLPIKRSGTPTKRELSEKKSDDNTDARILETKYSEPIQSTSSHQNQAKYVRSCVSQMSLISLGNSSVIGSFGEGKIITHERTARKPCVRATPRRRFLLNSQDLPKTKINTAKSALVKSSIFDFLEGDSSKDKVRFSSGKSIPCNPFEQRLEELEAARKRN